MNLRHAVILKHINFRITKKKEKKENRTPIPKSTNKKMECNLSFHQSNCIDPNKNKAKKRDGQIGGGNEARSQIEYLCSRFRLATCWPASCSLAMGDASPLTYSMSAVSVELASSSLALILDIF